ncbi:MAG: hypothetical protein AAF799_20520 [Myxococcota bacterium]
MAALAMSGALGCGTPAGDGSGVADGGSGSATDGGSSPTAGSATDDGPGTSGADASGDSPSGGSVDDGDSSGGADEPWMPGISVTVQDDLPGGGPIACEWDWTIRLLAPFQNYQDGHAPRRMYFASCKPPGEPRRVFSSYTVGEEAEEGPDVTTGGLTVTTFNPETGALEVEQSHHFPECRSMHGIAAAEDCSTVAVLCRTPNTTEGADYDAIAGHPAEDWLTNENTCGTMPPKMNEHMWLYEWPDGDLSQPPVDVIVHKSIGSWEFGQNYLRYGENDGTYGIALKATVGEGTDCHEADSFMILDRSDYTFTNRGWTWACATGHTIHNRPAYDPTTQQYAMACSTDFSDDGHSDRVTISFRMEDDNEDTEVHYASRYSALWLKGGAGPLVARPGGGFLSLIVGEPDPIVGGYDDTIPTQLGLLRFDADGQSEGDITWVAGDDDSFFSWPQLAPLGGDRYLLGWGSGLRVSDGLEGSERNNSLRIPWSYWLMEIDGEGNPLTEATEVPGVGWGEVNEMIPMGPGRVTWSYVPDAVLDPETSDVPHCNQNSLVHYVYTSETMP